MNLNEYAKEYDIPLDTALAYALVRNGYAHFLTTEQSVKELFDG